MTPEERRPYRSTPINTVQEIYDLFDGMSDAMYELNWLVCGTSGVHGSYTSLDDCTNDDGDTHNLTVLVIFPRRVQMLYGDIEIDNTDIPRLRTIVTKSIAGIAKSQAGNRVD